MPALVLAGGAGAYVAMHSAEHLPAVKAALEQRNKIVHANVGELMFGGKSTFRHRRRKGSGTPGQQSRWETTELKVDELEQIGAQLFRASEELWEYVEFPAEPEAAD